VKKLERRIYLVIFFKIKSALVRTIVLKVNATANQVVLEFYWPGLVTGDLASISINK